MINTGIKRQREVFDQPENQYQQELILNPPAYTVSETKIVIDKVVAHIDKLDETIVDFGAGTGRLTIPLLRAGLNVLPIDVSLASLERLQVLVESLSLKKVNVSTALPEDGQCATVVGADILHHVPLDDYLPKIYRTLRPGGRIVFSEPGAFNPSWYVFVTLFVGWKAEKRLVTTNIPYLTAKLKKHGFSQIQFHGLGFIPRPVLNRTPTLSSVNDRLGQLPIAKLFAYRYIIEASR